MFDVQKLLGITVNSLLKGERKEKLKRREGRPPYIQISSVLITPLVSPIGRRKL